MWSYNMIEVFLSLTSRMFVLTTERQINNYYCYDYQVYFQYDQLQPWHLLN